MTAEPNGIPPQCDASGAPRPRGLYDPAWEHDSCGVGFVARLDGVARHAVVEDAVRILINLEHRGALGGDTRTGDGAGVLMQIPDAFLRAECQALHLELPRAGDYAVGMVFLPSSPALCERCVQAFERIAGAEGCGVIGWRRVPVNAAPLGELARATQPEVRQILLSRGAIPQPAFERKLYVIRRLVEKEVAAFEEDASAVPRRQPLQPDDRLQGHADRDAASAVLSRPARRALRERLRHRAPALQHQHFPDVAAGAAVPHPRAQRRDQHAARQHHPHARARGAARLGTVRRGHREDQAGHPRRRQRLGDARQRGRAAAHGRPLAAARDDDARARGVGRQVPDERGQARLLRISLPPSWSRGTGRRRWSSRTDRTSAPRSTGTACARRGTPSRATGWWSSPPRRACWTFPPTASSAEGGFSRARCSSWTCRASHHPGQRDQGEGLASAPVPALGQGAADRAARPAGALAGAAGGSRSPPPQAARLRVHRRRPEDDHRADGGARAGSHRLDGQRRGARGALAPAATALRVLQAALRPGDQPAD